jgi:hypothetical protein
MTWETVTTICSNVVTTLSLPIGIGAFVRVRMREKQERAEQTYNDLGVQYNEFLRVNLDNPSLKIDVTLQEADSLSVLEKRRQLELFFMLVSLLERAHVLFRGEVLASRKSQEKGWSNYMKDYGENENFRRLWNTHGKDFDVDFMHHMDTIVKPVPPLDDI